jgi:hypothetical protein
MKACLVDAGQNLYAWICGRVAGFPLMSGVRRPAY